jgi:RNA polymerase sigma-70 factor (ECF subfamily)
MVSPSNRQAVLSASAVSNAPAPGANDPVLAVVCEAKAGSSDGVRLFLQAIAPWVRRTCRGVLGASHPDLDDTIQECLFAAVKALRSYRFDGNIRHYVTKISLRIAIAAKRTNTTRSQRQDLLRQEQPWEGSVAEEWSTDEVDTVRGILDHLSGVQSEAVLMRIVLGFSVDEIATMTGVPRNTVKTRLRLGKNALRKGFRRTPFWKQWLMEKRQ